VLGNGLGPVVGGFLTEKTSWRWAFWFVSPLTAVAVVYLMSVLPGTSAADDIAKKLRMVDWLGVSTSMAAIILILIPVSQGGSLLPWTSPIVVGMLVSGALLSVIFVIIEWRLVKLPLLPSAFMNPIQRVSPDRLVQCISSVIITRPTRSSPSIS